MYLAEAPFYLAKSAPYSPLNTTAISALLATVFGLGVAVVAIRALGAAFHSRWASVLTIAGIVALAAMVYGLSASGDLSTLGQDLDKLVLNL